MGGELGAIALWAVPLAVLHGIVAVWWTAESQSNWRSFIRISAMVFNISCTLSLSLSLIIAVTSYSRLTPNQKHFKQIGRFHCFVVPCIYLRSFAIVVEQFASRTWSNKKASAVIVSLKQRFKSTFDAGTSWINCENFSCEKFINLKMIFYFFFVQSTDE